MRHLVAIHLLMALRNSVGRGDTDTPSITSMKVPSITATAISHGLCWPVNLAGIYCTHTFGPTDMPGRRR